MKLSIKNFIAGLTAFASSSKFTKEVTPLAAIDENLAGCAPRTREEWETLRPQLYALLEKRVRTLILAKKELADHKARYGVRTPDSGRIILENKVYNRKVDLIEIWGLLERRQLSPIDRLNGTCWGNWQRFALSVERDETILERIQYSEAELLQYA